MNRSRNLLAALALAAVCSASFATPGGEGSNTGCNGVGNANSPCNGGTNYGGAGGIGVGVGIGGNGGAGGAGGNANSISNATGGKSSSRSNSSLTSTIKTNQRQTTSVRTGDVKVAVQVPAATPAPAAVPQGPSAAELQAQKEIAAMELAALVASRRGMERPVSSAYAPNISPTSPCALTVSGGIQSKNLGISIGGTPIAEFCRKLEIARAAYNMEDKDTALEVMCSDTDYRAARKRAKKNSADWCADDRAAPVQASAGQSHQVTATAPTADLQLLP